MTMIYLNSEWKIVYPNHAVAEGSLIFYKEDSVDGMEANSFCKTHIPVCSMTGKKLSLRPIFIEELTNEEGLSIIELLLTLWLKDIIKSYNNNNVLLRWAFNKFVYINKVRIYAPYLWFVKFPLDSWISGFFISNTFKSKWNLYRMTWEDFSYILKEIIAIPGMKYRFSYKKADRKWQTEKKLPQELVGFFGIFSMICRGIEREQDENESICNPYYNKSLELGTLWAIKEIYVWYLQNDRDRTWLKNEVRQYKNKPRPFTELDFK